MKIARRIVQAGMLAVTLVGVFALRANAERWCPFGGIEAVYTYAREGNLLCSLGISNFYVAAALLLSVLLVRRAFCGYLCPIGTLSQWFGRLAASCGLRAVRVPPAVDRWLSLGKYVVAAVVVVVTWQAGELLFRGYCPAYALISRHGADITLAAYVVGGAIVVASLLLSMPFCRWFCPLATVMNPLSRFGLARVRRDRATCIDCGRCARVCPMAIPVDRCDDVTQARCVGCLKCIDACPAPSRALVWGPPRWLGGAWPRGLLIGVLLACMGAAVAAAYWAPLPSFVKSQGTPPAQVAQVDLEIRGLTCRGRANLLVGFLGRSDLYAILPADSPAAGYYRLEAWPDPNLAHARIYFDPRHADAAAVKAAITEPYFDPATNRWWTSPFAIEGYVLPGLDDPSPGAVGP